MATAPGRKPDGPEPTVEELLPGFVNLEILKEDLWTWAGKEGRTIVLSIPPPGEPLDPFGPALDLHEAGIALAELLTRHSIQALPEPGAQPKELQGLDALDAAWVRAFEGVRLGVALRLGEGLPETEWTRRAKLIAGSSTPEVSDPTALATVRGSEATGRVLFGDHGKGKVAIVSTRIPRRDDEAKRLRTAVWVLRHALQGAEKGVPLPGKIWTFGNPVDGECEVIIPGRGIRSFRLKSDNRNLLKKLHDDSPNSVPYQDLWGACGYKTQTNPDKLVSTVSDIRGAMRKCGVHPAWVKARVRNEKKSKEKVGGFQLLLDGV